jgi:hypothetical protein
VGARTVQVMLVAAVVAAAGAAQGAAAPAAVPASLVGCWSRHVPALPIGTGPGVWLIRIKSNGAFAAYRPGSTKCDANADFTSHVSVKSGRLTIGHVPVCATDGVYTVKPAAKSFALKVVADKSCSNRTGLLAGTWKRIA